MEGEVTHPHILDCTQNYPPSSGPLHKVLFELLVPFQQIDNLLGTDNEVLSSKSQISLNSSLDFDHSLNNRGGYVIVQDVVLWPHCLFEEFWRFLHPVILNLIGKGPLDNLQIILFLLLVPSQQHVVETTAFIRLS